MALLERYFPEAADNVGAYDIVSVGDRQAIVRLPYERRFARPGGTISGPTMFTLADMAAYVVILGELGDAAVDAVTTTLTINFIARPRPADLVCRVEILRLGRRQAVCEARIFSSDDTLVAQASCIYALPLTASSRADVAPTS